MSRPLTLAVLAQPGRWTRPRQWLGSIFRPGAAGDSLALVLGRGIGGALLAGVLSNVVGLGLQVGTSRVLGRDTFSTFLYVWTWINLLATLGVAGMDTVLIRFLPSYRAHGEWDLYRGLLRAAGRTSGLAALVLGLATAVVVGLLGAVLSPDLQRVFWIGCVALPVLAQLRVIAAVLRSLRAVVVADMPEALLRPALVLPVLAAGLVATGRGGSAATTMLVQVPAAIVALGLARHLLSRRLPPAVDVDGGPGPTAERRPAWYGLAGRSLWMTLVQTGMNRADVLLVGIFRGPIEGGIYAVAAQFAKLIAFGLNSTLSFLPGLIAELYATGRIRELQRVLGWTTVGLLAFTLPVFGGVLVVGPLVLRLYGPGYEAGYSVLVILALGQLADALSGPNNTLLLMTGHERQSVRILTTTAVLNLGLNLALIPRFGMRGAAVAAAVCLVGWNAAIVLAVRRTLGLRLFGWATDHPAP